uniref:Uncharacterized protein n=1 Tax=Oryza nivara TaxID=4536 RepID=A0A0E0J315_ORYNI
MMAGAANDERGVLFHCFDSAGALEYSMANAGSRFSFATEVCAKLMNGARYAVADPPLDSEDHKEFENIVVSDAVLNVMMINNGADATGWRFYTDDDLTRTPENNVQSLVLPNGIALPTFEINGGIRLRRRVVLPPVLMEEDGVIYHFLQYKFLPNVRATVRASILSGLAHGEALEELAIDARAQHFAAIAGPEGHDLDPEQWAALLLPEPADGGEGHLDGEAAVGGEGQLDGEAAVEVGEEVLEVAVEVGDEVVLPALYGFVDDDEYRSTEDDDYVPDEEESHSSDDDFVPDESDDDYVPHEGYESSD